MRLTNQHRTEIIEKAIKKAFEVHDAQLVEARKVFATELYVYTHGKIEPEARKLPKEWIVYTSEYSINCDLFRHQYGRAYPEKPRGLFQLDNAHPFPYASRDIKVDATHRFYENAMRIADQHSAIYNDKQLLESELRGLLYSVNTLEKLRAVWPEAEAYFPKDKPKPAALVPVGVVTVLNKKLGLA